MYESRITELLDAASGDPRVGPVPVDAMVAGARRARRRRATVALGGLAAAVVVVASVAVLGGGGGRAPVATEPTEPTEETPTLLVVPDGQRLVGVGAVGALVPAQWGTNETRCGTAMRDTVVIDDGPVCLAAFQRPRGVESLEITEGAEPFELGKNHHAGELAGQPARLTDVECASLSTRKMVLCQAVAYLPRQRVGIVASSSTQPESAARAHVTAMLEGVRMLEGEVGVPDYRGITTEAQGKGGAEYAERLAELGLGAEIVTRSMPGVTPGYVLDVSPQPGTVLSAGDSVRVTVVAEPDGPGEEVRVGMNSDAEGWDPDFDDADVRAGSTVHIRVGDGIWSYADGKRARTLAGALDGDSLAVDGWEEGPNHPHSWVAVRPGTTTITLTITADGEPVVLGRVTVVVRE